ncbi:MAG: chromate efflux transporter [Saccharospirillum sp.]
MRSGHFLTAVIEVFWRFLLLGLVSFGGPAAHLGYFRQAFVERRQWLSNDHYGQLVALCQFLPGPASSQVGFAIGHHRAGIAGALAAFIGFTLPSFILMTVLAVSSQSWANDSPLYGVVTGLKVFAVVVVADAVTAMFGTFCRTRTRRLVAVALAAAVVLYPSLWVQMGGLVVAAVVGGLLLAPEPGQRPKSDRFRWLPLVLFAWIVLGLALALPESLWRTVAAPFFQAGSLVFGGGHVVLPLLQQTVGEAVSADRFLFGYASAQAVPGPMFTLSAFLGAELWSTAPWLGALVAVLAIFAPGFLLLLAFQGAWYRLTARPLLAGAVAGINAAVVGLLLAALYQPVFIQGVAGVHAMVAAALGFAALRWLKVPVVVLAFGFALLGVLGVF